MYYGEVQVTLNPKAKVPIEGAVAAEVVENNNVMEIID